MAVNKTEYLQFGEELYEVIPPAPTETERGGIIASPKTDDENAEVKLGVDGKLYAPSSNVTLQPQSDVKAYLTGTTSEDGSSKTLVFDSNVYLDAIEGRLHVTSIQIGDAILFWNSDKQCLQVEFANSNSSTNGGE